MCFSCICLFVLYVLVFVIFLFLLVSGVCAVCDCRTPWTFLLTSLSSLTMDETFQLPNEVRVKHDSDVDEILDEEMSATETYMSKTISKPNKIRPTEVATNKTKADELKTCAVNVKTLAEQATTLRRLKWFSIVLAISTVINSATFGGIISHMVSLFLQFTHLIIRDRFHKRLTSF